MPHLFSYGTLQRKEIQQTLYGRVLESRDDVLEGYKITWIEITDEEFLVTGESSRQRTLIFTGSKEDAINGKVLEITEDELLHTDAYEPFNYKRKEIILQSGQYAWVYIAF